MIFPQQATRGFASLLLTLAIVAGIVVLGGAGWWVARHVAVSTSLATDAWPTYENTALGFSFSYPQNLTLATSTNSFYKTAPTYVFITLSSSTPQQYWGKVVVNEMVEGDMGPEHVQIATSTVSVDGVSTLQTLRTESGSVALELSVTYEGNTYALSFAYTTQAQRAVTDAIVHSFKFLAAGGEGVTVSPLGNAAASSGLIIGSVSYPSSCVPAQTVCAESVTDASEKYCSSPTNGGCSEVGVDRSFSIEAPAGTYYVYAHVSGGGNTDKAYYDEFVRCGTDASCPVSSHAKYVPVTVAVGQTVTANPTDWYGWQGTSDSVPLSDGMKKFYSQRGFSLSYPEALTAKTEGNVDTYPFPSSPLVYFSVRNDATQTGGFLGVRVTDSERDGSCLVSEQELSSRIPWTSSATKSTATITLGGIAFTQSDRTGLGIERDYVAPAQGSGCYDIQIVVYPTACVNSGCTDPKWSTATERAMVEQLDAVAQTIRLL